MVHGSFVAFVIVEDDAVLYIFLTIFIINICLLTLRIVGYCPEIIDC